MAVLAACVTAPFAPQAASWACKCPHGDRDRLGSWVRNRRQQLRPDVVASASQALHLHGCLGPFFCCGNRSLEGGTIGKRTSRGKQCVEHGPVPCICTAHILNGVDPGYERSAEISLW